MFWMVFLSLLILVCNLLNICKRNMQGNIFKTVFSLLSPLVCPFFIQHPNRLLKRTCSFLYNSCQHAENTPSYLFSKRRVCLTIVTTTVSKPDYQPYLYHKCCWGMSIKVVELITRLTLFKTVDTIHPVFVFTVCTTIIAFHLQS